MVMTIRAVVRFQSHLTVVGPAGGTFQFGFGALPFEAQLTLPYWARQSS